LLLHASVLAIGLAEKSPKGGRSLGVPASARVKLRESIDATGESAKMSALTGPNGEDLSKFPAKCLRRRRPGHCREPL